MPGPSSTESRWAPAITTLSRFLPGFSASTLKSSRVSGSSTSMYAVDPLWASDSPSAKLAPTTGIVRVLGPVRWGSTPGVTGSRLAAVPTMSSMRSGALPWLKITTASAPSSSAFWALLAKPQPPRWMSAMSAGPPKSRPVKSAVWQPLVLARSPVRLTSTGMTGPWTSPNPPPVKMPVSMSRGGAGVSWRSVAGKLYVTSTGSRVTRQPARRSLLATYSALRS